MKYADFENNFMPSRRSEVSKNDSIQANVLGIFTNRYSPVVTKILIFEIAIIRNQAKIHQGGILYIRLI